MYTAVMMQRSYELLYEQSLPSKYYQKERILTYGFFMVDRCDAMIVQCQPLLNMFSIRLSTPASTSFTLNAFELCKSP